MSADRTTPAYGDMDWVSECRELRLPLIPHLGAIATCKRAVDEAVEHARGVLVLGDKGLGKDLGLAEAERWFNDVERRKRAHNESYRIRRVKTIKYVRDAGYRETALVFARALFPAYADRVRGRGKTANEIQRDIVQFLLKSSYVALIVDEAERLTDDSLRFIRDLMADTEDEDRRRDSVTHTLAAAGVGFVIAGTPEVEERLLSSPEAGHRWAEVMRVPELTPANVLEVYATWLPAFRTGPSRSVTRLRSRT